MGGAAEMFAARFAPAIAGGGAVSIPSLTGAAGAFAALALASDADAARSAVLAVCPGLPDADALADDLRLLSEKSAAPAGLRILELPPPLGGDRTALGARLKAVAALKARGIAPYPCVVVTSAPALAAPLHGSDVRTLRLCAAAGVKFGDVCDALRRMGYERKPTVEGEGDWSARGGIVDAWSPGDEFPVRAEFFGDDLESVRTFDAATQRSIARVDSAELLPASDGDGETQTASDTLAALLPGGFTLLALEHNSYPVGEALTRAASVAVYTGDPAPAGVRTFAFQTVPLPGFGELGVGEAHHPELFDAARTRLERHLAATKEKGVEVANLDGLSGGFEIAASGPGARDGLVVVTKADRVFTRRRARTRRPAAPVAGARLGDFDDLEPGEYVVHVDYGVGRFVGSSEIVMDGKRSEVFTVEYADGGKLHVPAAHAHLLTRYVGVKGQEVHLNRLDGRRWAKDKAAAQKAVADLAAALLETQAKRQVVPGFAYDVECDGMEAFEAAFPYEETQNQETAIAAVKKDLASPRPMDRLVCGDAGYGKTEVAMRAAYIAAMNGKQTAVLAPTTILAEQHFETFTSRFDGTPVRIESVSRFQSVNTHHGTFSRIASGVCDIVIGTHAILSPRISFHDLGLVIIDEEQRFGVRHKEFLKRLRATADVLTLSATPIPRTLYLSMTGARDLSLLRTPPRERVAVETVVARDSDEVVRAAVEAELSRAGQVFFLHNRVSSLPRVERRLASLFPKARIVVAHGQMDSRTLAAKMREFERGNAEILLSTTIIESGIDIPRANTIIVSDAHTFGLADLYQLRGRVGRSSRQGRAYFMLPASGIVDSDARERLAALKRHGALGSGFGLAVRDLELRGAGNLLGSQQSGHIAAVGFTLYCQLLKRTVAMMKGEKVREVVDVKLNLDFVDLSPASGDPQAAAALPYDYVEEDSQRMMFMKRLAEASETRDVKAVAAELKDRFGPLPPAAKRLVRLSELRVACAGAGIGNVDVAKSRAVFCKVGSRDAALVRRLEGATPDAKIRELSRAISDYAKNLT